MSAAHAGAADSRPPIRARRGTPGPLSRSEPWSATNEAVSEHVANAVPGMLYRLWQGGEISDEQLPDAVTWTWVHNRSPIPCLGERRWLALFKAAGFIVGGVERTHIGGELVPDKFEHLTELPTEPITVWRGAALPTKGRGLSWSIHYRAGDTRRETVNTRLR